MHSARWDSSYDLKGKTVAVVGGGSSAVQIVPSIQPSESSTSPQVRGFILTFHSAVGRLFAFLRSPVWITTGFGAKYAGPGGTNFNCEYFRPEHVQPLMIADSKEQIAEFNADSEAYTQYARDVEGELNKRFTLVSSFRRRLSYILT